MTNGDDVYEATVGELIKNFHAGLLAVIPVAEKARMNYRDEDPHRDWEQLAEALFDAFVRGPAGADQAATGREFPLARYDIDLDDYLAVSWLAIDSESPYSGAMVRLLSRESPFDTVQVVAVDPTTLRAGERRTVRLSEIRPVFFRRRDTGDDAVVTRIRAIE